MTPQDLQNLFTLRGITSKVRGDEVQVETCVFCGNPKFNLEVNVERNAYHAWCCNAKGRAATFIKEHLGLSVTLFASAEPYSTKKPTPHPQENAFLQPLSAPWALQYLSSRQIDPVDLLVYEITQGKGEHWEGRVVFPAREYWTQEIAGYVGRAAAFGVHPKYYAQWNDNKKVVTGYRSRAKIHLLVEGPVDGIRAHQAGFNAAVLGGVSGNELEMWAARVDNDHHIVVCLDGDAREQAEKLLWRIRPVHEKSIGVYLPETFDPGELDRFVLHQLVMRTLSTCSSTENN